ncbi:MAG: WD40/YVTN/BNR-like repeat-containing protein, partial [Bacteroidota bacterium]
LYVWDYSSFGGCYRSLDSARSWQRVLPDYGAFHSIVDTTTGIVYASVGPLSVSTDCGTTWSFYSEGIPGTPNLFWLAKRQGSDTMYCINANATSGAREIYISITNGISWRLVPDTLLGRAWLRGPIGVSGEQSNIVYVGAAPARFLMKVGEYIEQLMRVKLGILMERDYRFPMIVFS